MLPVPFGNDFVVDDIEVTDILTGARVLREDFEVFSSYAYRHPVVPPGTFYHNYPLWPEGTYTLAASPVDVHPFFANFANHTPGGSKMMIVMSTERPRPSSGLERYQV